MENLNFENFKLSIDPDSNFWVIYDDVVPEEIMEFYRTNCEELKKEMENYRFEVNFNTVYLNPTEKCNANCPYCYIPEKIRKRGRFMQYEQLEEILNALKDLNVSWIIFHGSEPLIVKDTVFKAIENFDFNFGIQTNGFLLEEDDVDFIKSNNVNLGVSFDSPYEQTNDFLRGNGHYKCVTKILEWFKGYENFNVITTINKYNYKHLADMVDFLAGKVEVVLINPVRGTNKKAREIRADAKEAAFEFIKAVERSIELTKDGKRIVIGDFANMMLGIVAPTSRVLQCDISPCGAGRRFFAVAIDGIFPCSEFIGLKEFKVDFSKIKSLENEFFNVRSRIVEKIEECRGCPYRNFCGSPCPAEVYAEYGNLLRKSPYCEFYKEIIKHAFKVLARGDANKVVKLEKMKQKYSYII